MIIRRKKIELFEEFELLEVLLYVCLGEWHGGKAGGDVLRLFHPQLVLDPIPFQLTTQILQPLLVWNLG